MQQGSIHGAAGRGGSRLRGGRTVLHTLRGIALAAVEQLSRNSIQQCKQYETAIAALLVWLQGFYVFIRALQLLRAHNDGVILVGVGGAASWQLPGVQLGSSCRRGAWVQRGAAASTPSAPQPPPTASLSPKQTCGTCHIQYMLAAAAQQAK